jgi:hypothetical protein
MFFNGSNDVNALRADGSASVALGDPQPYEQIGDVRAADAPTVQLDAAKRDGWKRDLSENFLVSVFIELTDEAQSDYQLPENVQARLYIKRGNIAVADIPLVQADRLTRDRPITEVSRVSLGEPLVAPRPRIAASEVEPRARTACVWSPQQTITVASRC